MASHELSGIIGIIAIWTTLGAFFAGYYVAKRKSKTHIEKSGKNMETKPNDSTIDTNSKSTTKRFDWI